MSPLLLTLCLAAQAPAISESPPPKPAAAALPTPVQEVVDRFKKATPVSRAIGGVILASGAILFTVGAGAAVLALGLRFSPSPATPTWEEEPRHTAGALSAAVAAAGLLLGSVLLVGGIVGAVFG